MIAPTHFLIGIASGIALASSQTSDLLPIIGLSLVSGIGALVPDIDHPNSKISHKVGRLRYAYSIPFFWNRHRGLTHSLFLLIPLLGLVYLSKHWLIAVFVLGYASHILADMLTIRGVPLFFPVRRNSWYLLPKMFRIESGQFIEKIVFIFVCVLILLLLVKIPSLNSLIRI